MSIKTKQYHQDSRAPRLRHLILPLLTFALLLSACGPSKPSGNEGETKDGKTNIEKCGNGVVDSDETCDTKIAAGEEGACPTDCSGLTSPNKCTKEYQLVGTKCQAECKPKKVKRACSMVSDQCCPAGCAGKDVDCPAPPPPPKGVPGAPCTKHGDCGDGGECVFQDKNGSNKDGSCTQTKSNPGECPPDSKVVEWGENIYLCLPACQGDRDCREGYECSTITNTCVSKKGPFIVSSPCTKDDECNEPVESCRDVIGDGQKYCALKANSGTGKIGTLCDTFLDCAGGEKAICHLYSERPAKGTCTLACSNDTMCGTGARCISNFCRLDCTSDPTVCNATPGYTCDATDHYCRRDITPEPANPKIGDKCSADRECGKTNERCLAPTNPATPGGYCTKRCYINTCPEGSACIVIGGDLQFCYKTCKNNNDCPRAEYSCKNVQGKNVCDI